MGTDTESGGELVDVDPGGYTTDEYQPFDEQQQ